MVGVSKVFKLLWVLQLWRASGITSELQLYSTAIGGLVMAAAMFLLVLVPLPQKCTKT
jgi:predicted membrane-bound dolichyl-phosphate-mannose-protein mannosyltransferase